MDRKWENRCVIGSAIMWIVLTVIAVYVIQHL